MVTSIEVTTRRTLTTMLIKIPTINRRADHKCSSRAARERDDNSYLHGYVDAFLVKLSCDDPTSRFIRPPRQDQQFQLEISPPAAAASFPPRFGPWQAMSITRKGRNKRRQSEARFQFRNDVGRNNHTHGKIARLLGPGLLA